MSNWRAMMHGSFSPTQYPQNPQKGSHRSNSEDFEEIEDRHNKLETVFRIPRDHSATQTDDVPSVPLFKPGDLVEWLSPALPRQRGEVLAIEGDHFTVFHPLAEALCRLPVFWVTRVVKAPTSMEEPTQ